MGTAIILFVLTATRVRWWRPAKSTKIAWPSHNCRGACPSFLARCQMSTLA
ncbi:unnamed protein product [Symbiodinium sp. CCMP2592]|nr:unnamed protein product [Symbiodinium sp. CCMP2592]